LEASPPFGVTKSILLRAAWAILSSHLTGTEEVVFGLINNGRNLPVPGVAQITGPTINLVPLVLQIDSNQKVRSFLSQVQQQAVDMMTYESSGISKIRKYLAGEENTTMDFQTLLVVQPMEFSDAIETSTHTLGLEYIDELGTKEQHSYPLVVTFTLSNTATLKLEVQHDTRVVSTKQAENLTHQLQRIISQLSRATEDDLVGSITSLSEHDIHQIRDWNKNTPPPERTTIHHLFRRQVLKQPDSPAVCDLEKTFSYRQVDEYSSYLAAKLAKLGIAPGNFVGVCFEKSIWTVIAILAVFKVGGVYVPLDPAHPHARILEVINTVQIGLVVASAAGAKLFDGTSVKVVTLDDEPSHEAWTESPEPLTDSTAYLLFTSGTTGKPKGILMSHFAICTSIIHHGTAYGAGKHWRTLQFGAHTFDLSIGEFFTTLAFGGCICVPSEHERMNNLAGAITSLNVNTLLVVPTVANLLFPKDVPTLKTIVLAGEPITKETIVRWADHVDLTAGYGPSETAVYCSGNLRVSSDAHPAHIGKNIGATMWIVNPDNYHELSAVGCIGEIVISGPLLGQGYFNDKATTEAAFVPAPKWMKEIDPTSTYNMLYRSGDLAKYNDDGSLHIVGRRDTQVKLRGFRIELGEIENQIMAYGNTSAVLAHLPKEGPCAQQIVVVLSFQLSSLDSHANSDITLSKELHSSSTEHKLGLLKQHLAIHLPGYMIPTIWIVLDRMPLLISGKIDRKALKTWVNGMEFDTYKQLVQLPDTDDASMIVPGSTADILRKIWSDVLSVPSEIIGLKTSFFALGGDSIAAIQIVTRAKNVGISITVRGIIRGETLEHLVTLAEVVKETPKEAIQPSQDTDSIATLLQPYEDVLASRLKDNSAVQVEDAYPLAPFQREIMRQRAINPDVFIISWQMEVFHLSGPQISLDRLAKAWNLVVQKYSVLRSIYLEDSERNGEPLQVVLKNAQPEIVISSASEDEVEPTFETAGTPHIDDCFLPHRAHFIKHGNRYFAHIELDHRTIDGWSLKLIKTALLQAYENEEKFLAQQPAPYKAFVSAHDQDRVKNDDDYWVSVLRDQRPSLLSFPVTSEKIEVVPSRAKTIIYLPEITSQGLTPFSVKNSITYASIFNAAWAQTLSTYTQSKDAAFEYIISGREEDIDGVFDIVGPLINALPLHLRDIPNQHDNGVLAHLAHQIQEQQAQDGLHSSSNVREVIETHLGNRALFNTALNFQRRPTAVELGGLKVDDDLRKSSDPWHVS
jgi:amino acid adenylation domain-containing protein